MKEAEIAIKLDKLTKTFVKNKKRIVAVREVSLTIPKGIVFGLLGPNGAGKTTTISMICTLLRPTKGTVYLFGKDVRQNTAEARRQLGLVFQEHTLDEELSAYDNLKFQVMLYKLNDHKKRIKDALRLVGLEKNQDEIVKQFSGGMKRRLEIARALISEPKIILLDEPTLGLDAAARKELWQYIGKLISEKGLTVLLTTHYLEEAERMSSRVAIIDQGKIVAQGTPDELIRSVAADIVTLTLREENPDLAKKLKTDKNVKDVKQNHKELRIFLTDADTGLPSILRSVPASSIERLEINKPTLEDAYLRLTGKRFDQSDAKGGKRR